jgi:6-phosphogluconolactonase
MREVARPAETGNYPDERSFAYTLRVTKLPEGLHSQENLMKKSCLGPCLAAVLFLAGCGSSPVSTPPPSQHLVPKFAYVTNYGGGTTASVSGFTVNAATGALTAISGSPFTGGSGPNSIALHPSGKFLYVADVGSFDIAAYSLNSSSGSLTPVPGSPFPTADNPEGLTISGSGNFLYVSNVTVVNNTYVGTISAFSINPNSGVITSLAGSPFPAGQVPDSLTTDRSGKFLYVTDIAAGQVLAYVINQSTGALTTVSGSPFVVGVFPAIIAADPKGDFVYLANEADVLGFAIDTSNGGLTPVPGSPFVAGAVPLSVAIDPAGRFVYVTNTQSANVSAYSINSSTGSLTEIAGSPFAAGSNPAAVTVDPTGKFVYVTDYALRNINTYTIGSTGALTAAAGSPLWPDRHGAVVHRGKGSD